MLKKASRRGIGGFAFGVLIGQIISIFISVSLGNGEFIPVVPEFRALFSDEIGAVITQTLLTGVIGTVFAVTSLVFEIEKWGSLKQYIVHFIITSTFWVPIVYLCWMPQDAKGILICFISFLVTYAITWFVQYRVTKDDIRKINEVIRTENNEKEQE